MKKLAGFLVAGALMATGAMAATWTGTISDSMCGAKHVAATAEDAKCATTCIKEHGAEAVFINDGKVLKLDAASREKVADMIGKKVTITGSLNEGTVKIDEVKEAE